MKFTGAKLGVICAALVLLGSAARPQAEADAWVKRNFPLAFEELFPIATAQGDFVAVRAHRDVSNSAPEFSVVLENVQDARAIGATIREAEGAPVYQQLAALHAQQPSASYADLKGSLKVRVLRISGSACPAVAVQFNKFQHINFVRPRDDDDVDEDPMLYQVHESVGGGDSEVLEFAESRAIPKWTNETHAALDACAANAPKNP